MVLRPRDENNQRTVFRPREEYKCFVAPEWGQMGHLITDYRWLWYYAIRMEMKVAKLEQQVGNLELQLTIWQDNTANAERALANMTGLLNKEHAWRTNLERREKLELWLWRGGTVVGIALAAAFGVAYGVAK